MMFSDSHGGSCLITVHATNVRHIHNIGHFELFDEQAAFDDFILQYIII